MHLLIQWRYKLRSAARPAFVYMCVNERCVGVLVCMCPPGPVNKLHESQHSAVLLPRGGIQTLLHSDTSCTHRYRSINTHRFETAAFKVSESQIFIPLQLQEIKNSNEMYPYSHTQNHAQTLATVMVIFSVSASPAGLWSFVVSVKASRLKLCSKTAYLHSPARSRRNPGVFRDISRTTPPFTPRRSRFSLGVFTRSREVSLLGIVTDRQKVDEYQAITFITGV